MTSCLRRSNDEKKREYQRIHDRRWLQTLQGPEAPYQMGDFVDSSFSHLVGLRYWRLKLIYEAELWCTKGVNKYYLFVIVMLLPLLASALMLRALVSFGKIDDDDDDDSEHWSLEKIESCVMENASSYSRLCTPSSVTITDKCNTWTECIFLVYSYLMDPSTHLSLPGDGISSMPLFKESYFAIIVATISFATSLYGVIAFAIVSGFAIEAVLNATASIQAGSTRVIEYNHHLICGWTNKTPFLMHQLSLSMESEGGGTIVLLTDRTRKVVMDRIDEMYRQGMCVPTTKIVIRTGDTLLPHTLRRAAALTAKSVVILADPRNPKVADSKTLRSLITIETLNFGREHCVPVSVVAELNVIDNLNLVESIFGDQTMTMVEGLAGQDLISRIMVKAVVTPKLCYVLESLLGYEGDEVYFHPAPMMYGKKFGELLYYFPDTTVIGYLKSNKKIVLNPFMDAIYNEGDEIILIAEDNSMITELQRPVKIKKVPMVLKRETPPKSHEPEKILICGWRNNFHDLLFGLDREIPYGSSITIFCEKSVEYRINELKLHGYDIKDLKNSTVYHYVSVGDVSKRHLLCMRPPMPIVTELTNILIVADVEYQGNSMMSDSRCLSTLMAIQDCFSTPDLVETVVQFSGDDIKRDGLAGLDLDTLTDVQKKKTWRI